MKRGPFHTRRTLYHELNAKWVIIWKEPYVTPKETYIISHMKRGPHHTRRTLYHELNAQWVIIWTEPYETPKKTYFTCHMKRGLCNMKRALWNIKRDLYHKSYEKRPTSYTKNTLYPERNAHWVVIWKEPYETPKKTYIISHMRSHMMWASFHVTFDIKCHMKSRHSRFFVFLALWSMTRCIEKLILVLAAQAIESWLKQLSTTKYLFYTVSCPQSIQFVGGSLSHENMPRAPDLTKRALYHVKGALYLPKEPYCIWKELCITREKPYMIPKKALYNTKRAIFHLKRALHHTGKALYDTKKMSVVHIQTDVYITHTNRYYIYTKRMSILLIQTDIIYYTY